MKLLYIVFVLCLSYCSGFVSQAMAVSTEGIYLGLSGGFGYNNGYEIGFTESPVVLASAMQIESATASYRLSSGLGYLLAASLGSVFNEHWAVEGELSFRAVDQSGGDGVHIEGEQAGLLMNLYYYAGLAKHVDAYVAAGAGMIFFNAKGAYRASGILLSTGDAFTINGIYYNALKTALGLQLKIGLSIPISHALMFALDYSIFGSNTINDPHDIGSVSEVKFDTPSGTISLATAHNRLKITGIEVLNSGITATLRLFFAS